MYIPIVNVCSHDGIRNTLLSMENITTMTVAAKGIIIPREMDRVGNLCIF